MEMTEKPTGSGVARWSFYLMGLLILAMGLTLNTKAGLGVSPIISLSYAASVIWNRNFGDMTFVLYGFCRSYGNSAIFKRYGTAAQCR